MRLILFMRKFITLSVILVLAGCKQMPDIPTAISPYRIDIQQGNLVTQEMVAKLKPGMTRSQVRFVLGSPLVVDPFRTDRWDYVYMFQKQGKETERRNISVIFDDDKLVRIDGDVTALQPTVNLAPPPVEKPAAKPPAAATPAVKPPSVATPAPKPQPAAADKPAAAKPDAATATVPPATTKSDSAKSDVKADAAKSGTQAAKSDDQKDKPKDEKGFFGRMLDKIGF